MNDISNRILIRMYSLLHRTSIWQLLYEELRKQISERPEIGALFPEEKITAYSAHEPHRNTAEHPDLYITQIRYHWMYGFFRKNYSDIFNTNTEILKVGDPSGNLLEILNKRGTSVNINKECVDFIEKKGIKAVVGDAENLEFKDSSFDYVFCFQSLEHMPNPIRALNEFARITRKRVFISIPYTTKTVIYDINYWLKAKRESWGLGNPKKFDGHVFEFSTEDFKKILSYTNLECIDNFLIPYFDENTFVRRLLNRYPGSYFNFFVLEPTRTKGDA